MPNNLYRRGAVWWCKIQSGGKPHRRSLRTGSRAEAIKRLEKIRSELRHARFHGEERHSWKSAIIKWAEEFLPGISPKTAKRYQVSARQFDHLVKDLYVDEIDRKIVAKVAGRKGATNATKRRDLTALASVLRCCVGWGWREGNPAKDYDRGTIPERKYQVYLPTDAEVAELVGRCSSGLGQLVRWLDQTGSREEEGASLEHPRLWLDLQEATLIGKRGKVRTIRLRNPGCPDGVGTKVGTPRHLTSRVVFWHDDGERYHNVASQLRSAIKILVEKNKIRRFRAHDLRHRFAVRWLRAGGDIYALSRHLGHTSVKTTEVYLRFIAQDAESESAQKSAQLQRFGGADDGGKSA